MQGSITLAKYLDDEQRNRLAVNISQNLESKEAINALHEVIGLINEDALIQISPKIVQVAKEAILAPESNGEDSAIFKVLKALPTVSELILEWTLQLIQSIVNDRLNYLFDTKSIDLYKQNFTDPVKEIMNNEQEQSLESILTKVEQLYSLEVSGILSHLDKLIVLLLGSEDSRISIICSKILRWRSESLSNIEGFLWDVLPLLVNSDKVQTTNGYILWLRYLLNISNKKFKSDVFQSKLISNDYWLYIQKGLGSSVHDHRKYSLSILKLSIQQIDTEIDNDFVKYNQQNSGAILDEWKRYSTIFEIIGIDTALNQAEAAKNDIIQLLTPDSYVKPSWGMVLLSTAFKGSMESVRKFALNIMYSTPADQLSIYSHEYLTSVFLKYAAEAPHFQVNKVDQSLTCEYGIKLRDFIENLLKSLKTSETKFEETVTLLLDLLLDLRSTFAPARFYISYGLLRGLKGKNIFTQKHVFKIIRLFESTSEDEVFETSIQTIHLKLLNHIKPDIPLLLNSLTKFVQYNGYELFAEYSDLFIDYVSTFNDGSLNIDPTDQELEYQIICFHLLDIYTITDEFLIELVFSKVEHLHDFSIRYSLLLTGLIKNTKQTYNNSTALIDMKIFRNSWKNLDLSALYASLKDHFDVEKFKFFVGVYVKGSNISDLTVVDFNSLIEWYEKLNNSRQDYKTKDVILGNYFDLLLAYLKMTPLSESQVEQVLTLLNQQATSSAYQTTISTCNILQYLFKNYDFDLITGIEILETIWDQMTAERLVLNQKQMHLKFIETLFDEKLLQDSINNEYNAKILHRIGLEVVDQAFTRRSFLPTLTSKLVNFQKGYAVEFNQCAWLIELILKSFTLVQDESNLFKLKIVLAKIYDNELKLHGDLYKDVFGDEEVSTRINIIKLLLKSSPSFLDDFFTEVLENKKYGLLVPNKKENGTEERQRVLVFSLLLLISQKIDKSTLSSNVAEHLLPALVTESSPLVRTYIEWIVSLDMIKNGSNKSQLFDYFKDQSKPALVTSAERIAFMTAQRLSPPESASYFDEFTQYLIPNCTSNKPLIRHFSNSLILSLFPALQNREIKLPVHDVLEALYAEAKKSEVTGQYRSGDALIWDAQEDFNLVSIFGGVLSKTSPRKVDTISQLEFTKYLGFDTYGVPIGEDSGSVWKESQEELTETKINSSSPLQTKSGVWESVTDIDQTSKKVKRSELIVISSLVDKPPNLGGICRLCDVLGAGLMTVDDLRVKKHPQFKNVAVTADYHMPITEVKIEDIPQFMKEKKREGYTLIGLEQTDQSQVLGKDTEFPAKSVILLGKEAEGIPGELLAELDYCIEIRQVGVIRSMNIQTATAVIVHAYSSSQFAKSQ
ncbi:tRNA guanosine-2'-O-methyltransferase TRM3 [Wickerhamomyces ciferrii]|uniref:tRNA guanosine-2'-O-methyltransferase TRM3 n=1 Tax=Wickerhamomyces ciferrii (strain ATCC 14091 / BCRC 22168 / CBS 111 / JCM 3599 / NBRC 0793 / NRRL Y-1031 F-60-10) TaxID=1206466 RepID=K0KBA8_WICCF|nr:tRNA guanosine-2'-O-methyltransferase TRM3 [Wickerhamomyces ciferrii]CCH42275.1 tRNA guanosine-2'-O-methyltransferase TRM3 [Wickerhamomyces ciferrii]